MHVERHRNSRSSEGNSFVNRGMLPRAVSFALHLTDSSLQKLSQQIPPSQFLHEVVSHICNTVRVSWFCIRVCIFYGISWSLQFLKKVAHITVHSLCFKGLSVLTNTCRHICTIAVPREQSRCSKKSPVFSLSSLLPPQTPGNHWSFCCSLSSFAFSRMSYSWNPTVYNLFRLDSFT